jgi:hypothetical protein
VRHMCVYLHGELEIATLRWPNHWTHNIAKYLKRNIEALRSKWRDDFFIFIY